MKRTSDVKLSDKGFTLQNAVREYEARFIAEALELDAGSVTHAARRLGLSHQSLAFLLQTRHKTLESKRTPRMPRKRSIIKKR